ncbi:MAG: hypothetical protein AB2729_12455 [Candidatus Thiodiazotropha taylori]
MEPEIIAAFIGVGGVSLGAFFSGVGYFIRSRAHQKRTKSRVLFYLLELRFALATQMLDPSSIKDQYLAYMIDLLKKRGISGTEGIEQHLDSAISSHFSQIILTAKVPIDEKLVGSYEASLQELSIHAPIRAYRLKGREIAGKLVECQKQYMKELLSLEAFQPNEALGDFIPNKFQDLNKEASMELLRSIESEIIGLAGSIGPITFLLSYFVIRNAPSDKLDFNSMGIEEILDNFLEEAVEQLSRDK